MPTPEALQLLERATFILRYAEQTKADMLALRSLPKGPVSLGLPPALAHVLTAPLVRQLGRDYPDIRLRIAENFSPTLETALTSGDVDLAIINGPVSVPNIDATPLLREAICVILPTDDTRLGGGVADVRSLRGVPLILAGIAKSGIRLELDVAATRAACQLNVVVEVESASVAKRLVLDGVGWTVHVAAVAVDEITDGRLRAVRLGGCFLQRSLVQCIGRPRSRATQVLGETIRDLVKRMSASGELLNCEAVETASE